MKRIPAVVLALLVMGSLQAPATADDVEPMSLSQCNSGYFCGWSSTDFTGTFHQIAGVGQTKTLSWSTKSYRNNRGQGVKLYNAAGTAYLCFAPWETRSSVPSAYQAPSKIYLSNTVSC